MIPVSDSSIDDDVDRCPQFIPTWFNIKSFVRRTLPITTPLNHARISLSEWWKMIVFSAYVYVVQEGLTLKWTCEYSSGVNYCSFWFACTLI